MRSRVYATVGRAADNDVVIDDPTVSGHHARLSWSGASLVIEDLSSANGTFVDGTRVKRVRTRPGAELRVGQVAVPWSHQGLRKLLKAGVGARTLALPEARSPSFVCGACGKVSALPAGPLPKKLTCPACSATLRTETKPKGTSSFSLWWFALLAFVPALALYYPVLQPVVNKVSLPEVAVRIEEVARGDTRVGSEAAKRLAAAFTPMDALTRNTAVKIAARTQGPFHVEQVAEIWNTVRKAWRYVNDPEGEEYYATATETIENGYVGDCDDFAITLASMVSAIGGKARVVLMDGPRGGHAYAEACVQGEPKKVATALTKHYRNRWRRYLKGKIPTTIAYRASEACPIWLNLDWNSAVPGGAYEPEVWAVAVYRDGNRETLTPAGAQGAADDSQAKPAQP